MIPEGEFIKLHTKVLIRTFKEKFGEQGPKVGAEVGVYKGLNAEGLLRSFPGLCLHLIDIWRAWDKGTEYRKKNRIARVPGEEWQAIREEALRRVEPFCTILHEVESVKAATDFEDGSLDFVFIDADHSYDSVMEDIVAWQPKVRSGGILSGHDYGGRHEAVKAAVDDVFGLRVKTNKSTVWMVDI